MCQIDKQQAILKGIKRGAIDHFALIVKGPVFWHSLCAFVPTMEALKPRVRMRKTYQCQCECHGWHQSQAHGRVTIPIEHRSHNHPTMGSAVSSMWLYPTPAR